MDSLASVSTVQGTYSPLLIDDSPENDDVDQTNSSGRPFRGRCCQILDTVLGTTAGKLILGTGILLCVGLLGAMIALPAALASRGISSAEASPFPYAKQTVFSSNTSAMPQLTYRGPSIVTAVNGTLLVFSGEREAWQDKSKSNIVMKRSTDNGKTWSAQTRITNQEGTQAYMGPAPVVDRETGRIYLFMTRWANLTAKPTTTLAFMSTSKDNGATWTTPTDVSSMVNAKSPASVTMGIGPVSGFQTRRGAYTGRLYLPTRQVEIGSGRAVMRTLYSDDHGTTWKLGKKTSLGVEQQIVEVSNGKLMRNIRARSNRKMAYSTDGGVSWGKAFTDPTLVVPSKGCQASLLNKNNLTFFLSPRGGPETKRYSERYNLVLWASHDDGKSWPEYISLYEKAAGYSGMTELQNGNVAVVFESAVTHGFSKPPFRGRGWLNMDVFIVPAGVWRLEDWANRKWINV